MNLDFVGYIGGTLTTVAAIPQIVKAIKTKSLDDFSWGYLGVLTTGVFLWLIYGLSKMDWVIIIANIVTFLLNAILCVMKVAYKKR